ncbi:MAG: hypothetical protein RIR39_1268 [Pseudomonadota bacterium]|jgi:hypothetical protein
MKDADFQINNFDLTDTIPLRDIIRMGCKLHVMEI